MIEAVLWLIITPPTVQRTLLYLAPTGKKVVVERAPMSLPTTQTTFPSEMKEIHHEGFGNKQVRKITDSMQLSRPVCHLNEFQLEENTT